MNLVSVLIWIAFGLVVGFVANMIMNKNESRLISNIIVGVAGSFLGGWLADNLGVGGGHAISWWGFVIAIVGSCLFIFILNLVRRITRRY